MRIGINVIDTIGIERRSAPDDAVYLITFGQQKFGKIRSILPGDPRDKRFGRSLFCNRSQEILLRKSQSPLDFYGTRDGATARSGAEPGVSINPRIDKILPTPIGRS